MSEGSHAPDGSVSDKSRRRRSGRARGHSFLRPAVLRIILILLVLALGLGAWLFITHGSRTIYDSKTLDFGLKDIGELSTQAGYYTNVNTITNPNRTIIGVEIPFTSSKALYTYQGVIKAGLNFADIQISTDPDRKIVFLTMPEIRILSNEIDLDSLKIYDESNSIFNKIRIENMNQSLITMKQSAEKQAIANGILEAAKENAAVLVRSLLAGFDEIKGYTCTFIWPENENSNSREGTP